MNEVSKYLAKIGARGGRKSRRTLDPATAREMVRIREARRASRRSTDTTPDADRLRRSLYAQMTPAERAARVVALTQTACRLTLAGLRKRHPDASPGDLLLHLAARRLGPDTVAQVYGWRAPDGP